MSVMIYKDNQWHNLAGNKIWSSANNEWVQVKDIDSLRFNEQWNTIGYHASASLSTSVPSTAPSPSLKKPSFANGQEPSGTKLYVMPNGTGDGSSWANACGVDNFNYYMQMANAGTNVYFLGGEYKISSPMFVPAGISIFGGFNPTDTSWRTRRAFTTGSVTKFVPSNGSINLFSFDADSKERNINGITAEGFKNFADVNQENVRVLNCLFTSFSNVTLLANTYRTKIQNSNVKINKMQNVVIEITSGNNKNVEVNGTVFGDGGQATIINNGTGEVKFTSSDMIDNLYVHTNTGSITFEGNGTIGSGCVISSAKGYLHAGEKTIRGVKIYVGGNVNVNEIESVTSNGSLIKAGVVGASEFSAARATDCKFIESNNIYIKYSSGNTFYKCVLDRIIESENDFYSSSSFIEEYDHSIIGSADHCTFVNCMNDVSLKKEITSTYIIIEETGNVENIYYDMSYAMNSHFFYLKDKKLYCFSDGNAKQISDLTGWTMVSGYSNSSYYGFGICDGKLYSLSKDNAKQISGLTGWTMVSGYSDSDTSFSYRHYGFGICDGKLYRLIYNGATRISDLTGWTMVSGHVDHYSHGYGICDGKLYSLSKDNAIQISDLTGWTMVSGYYYSSNNTYSSDDYYGYGICDGKLYSLSKDNAIQISDLTGWTMVSGFCYYYGHCYGYGICDGKLYSLSGSIPQLEKYCCALFERYKFRYSKMPFFIVKATNTKFINCFDSSFDCINTIHINTIQMTSSYTSSISFSTMCNCDCNANQLNGFNNVFWNCDGDYQHEGNAVTNASDGRVNLGTITNRNNFVNYGFTPEIGIQDVGECPDPDEDMDGYNEWMSLFGDWHPKIGSVLLNSRYKGTYDENISKDMDGNNRGNPPTLGCYEQ